MTESHYDLLACGNDDPSGVEVALSILSENPAMIIARVGGDEGQRFRGVDLFDCLLSLRGALEERGLLLCCQGARRTVGPSGMTRQMSNGRLAYVLRLGVRASDDDLVDIFAPADCADVASIAEQKAEIRKIFRTSFG
ncbi:hypothetical protein [Micromonospora sp. CNB394]|uniref:hypothetical protein n=1 Tax=Micromonospora sp. CNB394 TaxID=1169151 RepID=UPI0012DD77A0|nr:hypothetical protein [Micromonospora sp. CNB394]